MPLYYIRKNIAEMDVDMIVNTTNINLTPGVGVSAAIYKAAGEDKVKHALKSYPHCLPGDIVVTDGFDLKAKKIIHTVGPKYIDGYQGEAAILAQCYQRSLVEAAVLSAQSIAFPLIASGTYQFPKELALQIATKTIKDFLEHHELDVYLVVYDKESFQISKQLYQNITSYISEANILLQKRSIQLDDNIRYSLSYDSEIKPVEETFSDLLFQMIDQRSLSDVEVYKRANMDRKLFSKIRSDKHYQPKKSTVIALGIALQLSHREMNKLLSKAGYTLSDSILTDRLITYFLEQKTYDIHTINEALFYYTDKTL